MKLVGEVLTVKVTNQSHGRIARGRFSLAHDESKVIETVRFPEDILRALENFYAIDAIDLSLVEVKATKKKSNSNVIHKESVKNDKGDKHTHTVYDPDTADKNKAISVASIEDNSKAISVENDFKEPKKVDTREVAQAFLEQHWKKIAKDIVAISDIGKLEYFLVIAEELGMTGNKKHELIEDQIKVLNK